MKYSKKYGSVSIIAIIVCVFAVLAVSLSSMLNNTTNRLYATKKINETLLARSFANALANLSVQYLKKELKKEDSEIITELKKSISEIKDKKFVGAIKIDKLNRYSKNKEGKLIDILSNNSYFKVKDDEIKWSFEDLKPMFGNEKNNPPYEREKYGLISFKFEINYKAPGKKELVKENYEFKTEVRAAANLLPVLSKFTLYIEDAIDGSDNYRFNAIDTDVFGDLNATTGDKVKPWVLNNGGDKDKNFENNKLPETLSELIEDKRGFVYIGGGKKDEAVMLGIAAGQEKNDKQHGEYSESFHLYSNIYSKNPPSDPDNITSWRTLISFPEKKRTGILHEELGLYRLVKSTLDVDEDDEKEIINDYDWYKKYLHSSFHLSKRNSILKLYGTEKAKSPTLVLGYVNCMYASFKTFMSPEYESEDDIDMLEVFMDCQDDKATYDFACNDLPEDADEDLQEKYDDFNLENLIACRPEYKNNLDLYQNGSDSNHPALASKVDSTRYNKDYITCLYKGEAYPFRKAEQSLKDLADPNKEKVLEVPSTEKAKYADIYGNKVNLTELDKFIDEDCLSIAPDGKRIAHNLKLVGSAQKVTIDSIYLKGPEKFESEFKNFLISKGLLRTKGKESELDLNGWMYIDNESGYDITLNFADTKVVSHGGIILSKGCVKIQSDIVSKDKEKYSITILTLGKEKEKEKNKGDIVISGKVTNIDASLVSRTGQIMLEDDNTDLTINGSLIMKKIWGKASEEGNAGHKDVKMRRGLKLNYNKNLCIAPYVSSDDASILSLMMYSIKDNPKMY